MLVIGDEILSGRTQDTNTNYIARFLAALGIDLKEVRVVRRCGGRDRGRAERAARPLRLMSSPPAASAPPMTTSPPMRWPRPSASASAITPRPMPLLEARYPPGEFNEMRKRMARIPDGASLVKNSVSTAPGFQIGNVFVMAGVPMVMRAMLEEIAPGLPRGRRSRRSRSRPRSPKAPSRRAWRRSRRPSRRRHRLLSLLRRGRPRRAAGGARPRRGRGRSGGAGDRSDAARLGRRHRSGSNRACSSLASAFKRACTSCRGEGLARRGQRVLALSLSPSTV